MSHSTSRRIRMRSGGARAPPSARCWRLLRRRQPSARPTQPTQTRSWALSAPARRLSGTAAHPTTLRSPRRSSEWPLRSPSASPSATETVASLSPALSSTWRARARSSPSSPDRSEPTARRSALRAAPPTCPSQAGTEQWEWAAYSTQIRRHLVSCRWIN